MTIYAEVKECLEGSPRARERKHKNAFISWLLTKKHKLEMRTFNAVLLEQLIVEAASYDRVWRQVLQHEPHLRGKDYGEKEIVEQAKELELGYTPGYHQDVKKLQTL